MRNNHSQSKRMRGRNRGKSHNPLTRVYESNGPDVKIRGTANHVAEKYIQLARDAQTSGDPVGAENYYQHAEHYFRLIATAQEQFRQSQPFHRPDGGDQPRGGDESFDDMDEDTTVPHAGGSEPHYPREAREQPYQREGQQHQQRDQQPYPPRDYQPREQQPGRGAHESRPQQGAAEGGDIARLPSFITGGQPQPAQPSYGQNGYDAQGDRFPLHRRRRRGHRGPRPDAPGSHGMSDDGADDNAPPSGPAPAVE